MPRAQSARSLTTIQFEYLRLQRTALHSQHCNEYFCISQLFSFTLSNASFVYLSIVAWLRRCCHTKQNIHIICHAINTYHSEPDVTRCTCIIPKLIVQYILLKKLRINFVKFVSLSNCQTSVKQSGRNSSSSNKKYKLKNYNQSSKLQVSGTSKLVSNCPRYVLLNGNQT